MAKEDKVDLDLWARGHGQSSDVTHQESLESDYSELESEQESEQESELELELETESESDESFEDNLDNVGKEEVHFFFNQEESENSSDLEVESSPTDKNTEAINENNYLSLAMKKNETGLKEPSRN